MEHDCSDKAREDGKYYQVACIAGRIVSHLFSGSIKDSLFHTTSIDNPIANHHPGCQEPREQCSSEASVLPLVGRKMMAHTLR